MTDIDPLVGMGGGGDTCNQVLRSQHRNFRTPIGMGGLRGTQDGTG